MRLTVPHYHDFGDARPLVGDDLLNPEAWDNLRIESDDDLRLPPRPRGVGSGDRLATRYQERRARTVVEWLEPRARSTIASYGVGPAPVERWINRLRPEWTLKLTDYAPRTVERLRTHFPEAESCTHDFVHDPPLEADVHLFCCIDTELTRRGMAGRACGNFAGQPVLIYPCATFGLRDDHRRAAAARPGQEADAVRLLADQGPLRGADRARRTNRATERRAEPAPPGTASPRSR